MTRMPFLLGTIPPGMRALGPIGAIACSLLLAGCSKPGAGKTAYVGATVFDGTGAPILRNAVILVAKGRVEYVGDASGFKVPRGSQRVELDGKWVIPGLIDAHTHVERWTLPRYLAYGVTSVRDVGGQADSVLALRDAVTARLVEGPRMFVAGAMIDGSPATWPGATAARTPEEGRRAVDQLALVNASQAKIYTHVDRVLLKAITDEGAALQLPVTAHLGKVDAVTAARLGVSAIEHLSGVVEATVRDPAPYFRAHDEFFRGWNMFERGWASLDSAALQSTVQKLTGKLAIVPTLVLHQVFAHLSDSAFVAGLDLSGVPAAERTKWDVPDLIRRARITAADLAAFGRSRPVEDQFVRLFARSGGSVAAGTDSPNQLLAPGASLHDELALLVGAGLKTEDALLAATRNVAQLLHADSIGVIRPGALADFLVLGASPLADIANTRKIEMVVMEGRRFTPSEIRREWGGGAGAGAAPTAQSGPADTTADSAAATDSASR